MKSALRGDVRRQARPIVRRGSGSAKRRSLMRSSRTSTSARGAPEMAVLGKGIEIAKLAEGHHDNKVY
jgi:hypothetical protein